MSLPWRFLPPTPPVSRRETPTSLLHSHRHRRQDDRLAPSSWRGWRRFCRHRLALGALVLLTGLALLCASASWWALGLGVDGHAVNLFARLQPPSATHLLGTDELGRDVWLRLLLGGQVSLVVGFGGAMLATALGTLLGLVAGYRGGWGSSLIMRLADGVLALPTLPLLLVLAAVDSPRLLSTLLEHLGLPPSVIAGLMSPLASDWASVWGLMGLIALLGWPLSARLVYATTKSVCHRPFIKGAEALGVTPWRLLRVHVLPHVLGAAIVAGTLAMGQIILLESALSFLGLGIQPPLASWGSLLTNAQELLYSAPTLALLPGSLILVTALSCNLLGDGLADALNPQQDSH